MKKYINLIKIFNLHIIFVDSFFIIRFYKVIFYYFTMHFLHVLVHFNSDFYLLYLNTWLSGLFN